MGTRSVVLAAVTVLVWVLSGQARGDQPKEQSLDQLNEARVRVEILEMELAAELAELKAAIQFLKRVESPIAGSATPEPTGEQAEQRRKFLEETREKVKRMQVAYSKSYQELGRQRSQLAELEGRNRGASDGTDDHVATVRRQEGRGHFIQVGKYHLNPRHIEYVERSEKGWVHVYFPGNRTVILTGEAAKSFLEAIAAEGQ
jgi:chromosome segregation ATPase